MHNFRGFGICSFLAFVVATALGYQSPAVAASDPPDNVIELDAGVGCVFPLRIEQWGLQQVKSEKDKNGFLRTIYAGKGATLRFTNVSTGKTFSLKPNGSTTTTTTFKADNSSILKVTGHSVLIFFPADFPPGPSTTLHVGRVVVAIDPAGIWTLQQESGRRTDICAALS
jgi:hypothetical protein